ncbi:MAG: IS1634 family transposase [Bacteroidales bacterium]|nr:IS1634 family transposase [Bacteroidales bacterium]
MKIKEIFSIIAIMEVMAMAFIKVSKVKASTGRVHEYLKIVESVRENGKVKQKTVANLGNIAVLRKDIKQIVNGLLRACDQEPLTFAEDGTLIKTQEYGVRYVTESVWKDLELPVVINKYLRMCSAGLDYEKWILMMVVNKLSDPHSKLGIFRWLRGVYWPEHGFNSTVFSDEISETEYLSLTKREVNKFYTAMDHLISIKDEIEIHLYKRLRDLFSLEVDLVFYDLTSSYFEGNGPDDFAKLGYSRDKKPGNNQVVIGLIMCNGFPIGHELFEGNEVDKSTVKCALENLKRKYKINKCIFVGDRGLVTDENLNELEKHGFESIFALRRRRNEEVNKLLMLKRIYCIEKANLYWYEAKEGDIRYIVCKNPKMAELQKQSRENDIKILGEKLDNIKDKTEKLKKAGGLKKIIKAVEEVLRHNQGKRLIDYEIKEETGHLSYWLKEESVCLEDALDGVYVLRTGNDKMKAIEIIESYKDLIEVERAFRTMKSVLDLRPMYHWLEPRVRAHVLICYLAFLIERYVEQSLKKHNAGFSALSAFESLSQLGAATMEVKGQHYIYIGKPGWRNAVTLKALGLKTPNRCVINEKSLV